MIANTNESDNSKVYVPRCIKRKRRTKAELERIDAALFDVLQEKQPCTVRHAFYCMVGLGLIDKTEDDYKNVVVRRLTKLRRAEKIPWRWVADHTRLIRQPDTYGGTFDAIQRTAECYRRSMWDEQDVSVEIWTEKDAISALVYPITAEFDVPLMVARGFSSITFLQSVAEDIAWRKKPTFIYHLGDFDPSGMWIGKTIERSLREFAPDANMSFIRLAVNESQIGEYNLPTRPTKKSDSRAKGWKGECVEVDALTTETIQRLVSDAITSHIDPHRWDIVRKIEAEERDWLQHLAESNRGAA